MTKTFDQKCWELACHFLSDDPAATDADRAALASDIQQTAEDFCGALLPEERRGLGGPVVTNDAEDGTVGTKNNA